MSNIIAETHTRFIVWVIGPGTKCVQLAHLTGVNQSFQLSVGIVNCDKGSEMATRKEVLRFTSANKSDHCFQFRILFSGLDYPPRSLNIDRDRFLKQYVL